MLTLRSAHSDEVLRLTELCLRSKAVWGYGDDFMRACHCELTLTDEIIASSRVVVAEADGQLVGVAQLEVHENVAELDKLFVEPGILGSGVGRALFNWAQNEASRLGAKVMLIDADPHAVGFYRHMGATDDGAVPSGSIPGRVIPRLKLEMRSAIPSSV